MISPKANGLVLIHQKTRQRYPLEGDFVIGRSSGNLVFDHDPKLSGKHCLIRAGGTGFSIYDLKSRTGILINGVALPAGKSCVLKVGAQFTVGDQVFSVEGIPRTQKQWRLRPLYISIAIAIVLIAGFVIKRPLKTSAMNPKTKIDNEFKNALFKYQALGMAIQQRTIADSQSLKTIRRDLIPRFASIRSQLENYRSAHPEQNADIQIQHRLTGTYIGQLTAMGNFIETKDPKYSVEVGDYNRQMQSIRAQIASQQSGSRGRRPSSN